MNGGQHRGADRDPDRGADLRAEAARSLARIVFDGESLRMILAEAQPGIGDPRDRALFAALLFAGTRWWLRYDALTTTLLEKPLPSRLRDLRALLVLAFVQIAELGLPAYAVVAACVGAARKLGHLRHAGLVNAVLRRFVRELPTLAATLDSDPVTRSAHPSWLIDAIAHDWPEHVGAILAANNIEAPLTLRVNRRRSDPDRLLSRLRDAGIAAERHVLAADALVLAKGTDVTRLPGFVDGEFSVQDAAAQRVVELLDLATPSSTGLRVLDACAAPGGKAAHILERTDVDLTALDLDAGRVGRIGQNLDRLGLRAELKTGDASAPETWWDGRPFDRILLDAPCSATGILRRQPDVRLHRRATDIAAAATLQQRLLCALWPLLGRGGRLVYATCSLLRVENEGIVATFAGEHGDARCVPIDASFGIAAGAGRQNLSGMNGMDGFYYAVLEKSA